MTRRLLMVVVFLLGFAHQSGAVPIQWTLGTGANQHYYELITGAFTWDQAVAGAAARSHNGQGGYLATITSQDEQAFIFANVTTGLGWLGGSDRGSNGTWSWRTGPEAGTIFYQANAAVTYALWAGGEPNNCCGGEDDLIFGWGSGGSWNDIGLPAFPNYTSNYIVEYGGLSTVPEPPTLMLVGLGAIGLGVLYRVRAHWQR